MTYSEKSEVYDMFKEGTFVWTVRYNDIKKYKVESARVVETDPIHCKEVVLTRVDFDGEDVLVVFRDSPRCMYGYYASEKEALLKMLADSKKAEFTHMRDMLKSRSSFDKTYDKFNKL